MAIEITYCQALILPMDVEKIILNNMEIMKYGILYQQWKKKELQKKYGGDIQTKTYLSMQKNN